MSVGLLERGASFAAPATPNLDPEGGIFGSNLVGAVIAGIRPREHLRGRVMTTNAALAYTARGIARATSQTTGVYTARREFPDWEPTGTFSLIAYWYMTAYHTATQANIGNTNGSNGYSITERFGTGTRGYGAGGVSLAPSGSPVWPLNTPILSVLAYDASSGVLRGYMNGTDDGAVAGGGASAYDTFCRLFAGHNPDTGGLTGGVWYMGMVNRVALADEARALANAPWSLFAPQRAMTTYFAAAAAAADELFAQACL